MTSPIYFFKAIKNQAGYYLYGTPPRWHKFDASNPAPADAHKVVDHKAHVAAIEKLKEKHHASTDMTAEDMANEVHVEGEKIAAYKNAIARANDVKKKLLSGKNPQKNEVIWFWKAPEEKRKEVIGALMSSGNQFAIDGIKKIIQEHEGQASTEAAPKPVAEEPKKAEEPTFVQKLKDMNGDEMAAMDAADAYIAKNGKSAKTYQEVGQAMNEAGFKDLSSTWSNLSLKLKEGEASPADNETFSNEKDGTQSQVSKHTSGGWSVSLKDNDSGETMPTIKIFPSDKKDDAVAYAKKIVGEKQDSGWKPSYEDVLSLMNASHGDKVAKMQDWASKMGGMSKLVDVIKEYQAQSAKKDTTKKKPETPTIFAQKVEKKDYTPGDEIEGSDIYKLPPGSVVDAGDGTHKILVGSSELWFNNKVKSKNGNIVWQSNPLAPQHVDGVVTNGYGKMKVESLGESGWMSEAQKKTVDAILPAIKDNYPDAQAFKLGNSVVIGSPGNENSFKWFSEDGKWGAGFTEKEKAKIANGEMTPVSLGDEGPKEGDTKEGADGTLTFKDGRWHKQAENVATEQADEQESTNAISNDWSVSEHTHTKTGDTMAKVVVPESVGKMDDAQYKAVASSAKSHGGWWSKIAKGFLFKTPEEAKAFTDEMNGGAPAPAKAEDEKKVWLNVPFAKKEDAKKEGAKWDSEKKMWYATPVKFGTGPQGISLNLSSYVPKHADVNTNAKAMEAAALNLTAETGKTYEVHATTSPHTGEKAYYVATPDGVASDPYIEGGLQKWEKHGAVTETSKQAEKPKVADKFPVTTSGYLANKDGNIMTYSNLKQATMKQKAMEEAGYDVHITAQHPYKIVVNAKPGEAASSSKPSGPAEIKDSVEFPQIPLNEGVGSLKKINGVWHEVEFDGTMVALASDDIKAEMAEEFLQKNPSFDATKANPTDKPYAQFDNVDPFVINEGSLSKEYKKVDGNWKTKGENGWFDVANDNYILALDKIKGQPGKQESDQKSKLALADYDFPPVSTTLTEQAYAKINAVKDAAKAGDIDAVEALAKKYNAEDWNMANSSTKFVNMVHNKMKAKAGSIKAGPKEGDTKVENGVTYQLINGRWHKVNTMGSTDSQVIKIDDANGFKFKKMDGEWHFADDLDGAKWTKLTNSENIVKQLEAKLAEMQVGAAQPEPKAVPTTVEGLEIPDLSGSPSASGWSNFLGKLKDAVAEDPANLGLTVSAKLITITNKKAYQKVKVYNPLYKDNISDVEKKKLQFLFSLKALSGGSVNSGVAGWLSEQGYPVSMPVGKKPKKSKPKVVLTKPVETANNGKGQSIDGWKKVGEQAGSNAGGTFRDESGQDWYCKFPQSEEHVKNELLAAKLYEACGIPVPEVKVVNQNGKMGIASKIIPDLKSDKQSLIDSVHAGGSLADGFGADCWLANWDVVGLGYDNAKIDKDGNVYRIDPGGALLFRAQGTPKGEDFGVKVTETETLLNSAKNPQSASVFAGMSEDAINDSVAKVLELTDAKIKDICIAHGPGTAVDKKRLAEKLIARKNDLARQFPKAAEKAATGWVRLKEGEKIVEHGEQHGVKYAKIEVPAKGFDAESIPEPPDFFTNGNQGPTGKWKSSVEAVNAANNADGQALFEAAKSGKYTGDQLKELEFEVLDKATGNKTGEKKKYTAHFATAIKDYLQDVAAELNAQLQPTFKNVQNGSFVGSIMSAARQLADVFKKVPYEEFKNYHKKAADFLVLDSEAANSFGAPSEGFTEMSGFTDKRLKDFKAESDANFEKLSSTEKSACKSYTGSAYAEWNSAMRKGETDSHYFKQSAPMRNAFDKAAVDLPEGAVIWRGVDVGQSTFESVVGGLIQDGSFNSASYGDHPYFSSKKTWLKIHVGKGVKGVMATTFSGFGTTEREIIIQNNVRYAVLKVEHHDKFVSTSGNTFHGKTIVHVIALPHE